MKNNFGFFLPADVVKAKDDKTGEEKMQIAGIASTTDEDTDEEILLPSGFDLSYFTNNGFINWHHRQKDKPSAIIGEPSAASIVNGGKQMKVVCDLYNTPLAREVYDLGVVLQTQSKTGRRLGFSIEGKVLERDKNNPKIVTKAAITGCAITYQPKNGSTIAEIVKADGTTPDPDLSVDMEGLMEDLALLGQDAGQEILKACEYDMKKDVSEDLDKQNFETDEDAEKKEDEIEEEEKDKEKEVEKDLTAGSESGRALQTESLDGELKDGRSPFLSKAQLQDFMDHSGIEVDIEDFISFIYKANNFDMATMTTYAAPKITKDDLEKAMELLEKAGSYKAEEQPDEMEPDEDDEDDEDDKVEKASEAALLSQSHSVGDSIEKAIQTLASNYAEGFGALKTLIKGMSEEIAEVKEQNTLLKAQVDELNNAPAAQRKSLRPGSTKAIEKSFDNDLEKGGQGGEKTLSLSQEKGKVVAQLELLAFPASGGINETFAKAMTVFESSSHLEPLAAEALRAKGFTLLN